MKGALSEQMALITGATDGIGRLTAGRLARRGAAVFVHGRDQGEIDAVVQRIRAAGGDAQGWNADFAALARVRAMARNVLDAAPRLGILINNAGVGDARGNR